MQLSYHTTQNSYAICDIEYIKQLLRLSHDHDDPLIASLIEAAVAGAEQILNIKLCEHNVNLKANQCKQHVPLKYSPLNKIESVHLLQGEEKIDISADFGRPNARHNRIELKDEYVSKNLEIRYIAGHSSSTLPADLKQGIVSHVLQMYEQPERASISPDLQQLYQSHRIINI